MLPAIHAFHFHIMNIATATNRVSMNIVKESATP